MKPDKRPNECWTACGGRAGYCTACTGTRGTPGACCKKPQSWETKTATDPEECWTVKKEKFTSTGYHHCVLVPGP